MYGRFEKECNCHVITYLTTQHQKQTKERKCLQLHDIEPETRVGGTDGQIMNASWRRALGHSCICCGLAVNRHIDDSSGGFNLHYCPACDRFQDASGGGEWFRDLGPLCVNSAAIPV